MALKIAVFGIANLAYAAEINFTTCDLCLRNPNAIALGCDRGMHRKNCLTDYC
jgi:hypothetical protein